MRKYPRIEIDQIAYDGLQIEAVLRHKTTREIATEALLSHISREALSVLDQETIGPETAKPEDIATKRPQDHKTTEGAAIDNSKTVNIDRKDINKPKRKRLEKDLAAIQHIRELWTAGERNISKIAKAIEYSRSTVGDHIERMKKKGDLID
jgi:DNA-binding transcriptional ArsR family regulator